MRDAAATTLVSAIVWSVLTFAQDTSVPQLTYRTGIDLV